jgi:nucleoside-diphosphate-sugar epimerase
MVDHLNSIPRAPSRVVVIGSGGFVGGSLVQRLRQVGMATVPVDRKTIDLLDSAADSTLADLLMATDTVVAVAAIAPVKNALMLADNLRLVASMISALRKVPVAHVINISSDAVYADGPVPLSEASATAPTSLHGVMHLARELAFATELGSPLAQLRPTLIYGASDPHNGYGPNRFRRLADQGKDIDLFGEGEERRDHVFVDDVANLIIEIIRHKSVGPLNVATGQTHSFMEIAKMVVTISGKPSSIHTTPRVGPMPHNGYRPFDIAACRRAFPDFNYTPLREGLVKAATEA